jgi:hypothetical protein
VLRAIAGIRDAGELLLAAVRNIDGGDHVDDQGSADIWVHYEDSLTGAPGIARLFVPGNILFALPDADDTVMVARGRDAGGPGVPYLLHGDAGDASRVPTWLRSAVGLFTKKLLRLESKEDDVVVVAGSGKYVKLGLNATQFVALANLVDARLSAIVTAFNAHVHTGVTTGPGSTGTTATPLGAQATVAATVGKAE